MPSLIAIPFKEYEGDIFSRMEHAASYASLSESEQRAYDAEMKREWDRAAELETAMHRGEKKGRAEGEANKSKEIARNLKALGLDTEVIAQTTGLSLEEITNL